MKEKLKSEISKSIELLSKRPLKQIDINEATNVLATAIENYKSNQTPSTIQVEYNNLYAIHKNDNVVAKDLPYINREFYKHTFLPNEDVLIGFYVDTEKETYYRDNVNDIYKLMMYDNHELIKTVYINSGSQQMNFGKLSEGEHVLSYEVQDIYGRKSFRDYFEIRVKTPTIKSEYIITDSEIPSNSDSIGWLNQLILDLDESYNYLTLPTGTYKMKFGETLILKDNLTLNLNGSEIVLEEGQAGAKNLQVDIKQCYDAHVINGTIIGDRATHDYANSPNNSEWVNGIGIEGRSKYSSYENIEVRDITGYGSIEGFAEDRSGEGYCWAVIDFQRNWNKDTKCIESDFIDLTKFKVEGCEFIQVGRYLGYQGCPDSTWYFEIEMYNGNKELVNKFNGYYYRRIYIPKEVKYCKIYSFVGAKGMDKETYIFAFKTTVNCEFKNVRHIDCRCVGCAPTSMESLRLIDCYFTRCGQTSAKCAFDSEDGWDMMHDFYMSGCVFENNPLNDWLTCAGHNFLLENNKYDGNMYFWTRCQNYTVRNNKVIDIREGNNKSTHHVRIYDNECAGYIASSYAPIKKCTAKVLCGDAVNCTISSVANITGIVKDSTFILSSVPSNETQYIGSLVTKNCVFELAEGVTERELFFNYQKGNVSVVDCNFTGGHYFIKNYVMLEYQEFINCKFDSVFIEASARFLNYEGILYFKDCDITINGALLKFGLFSYSRGKVNVIFENCTITDTGKYTIDNYNAGSALINCFSKPVEGSVITFKNCAINKPTGLLVEGCPDYGSPYYEGNFKVDVVLENTPLSDNLQIQDLYNFKDSVNLIIK